MLMALILIWLLFSWTWIYAAGASVAHTAKQRERSDFSEVNDNPQRMFAAGLLWDTDVMYMLIILQFLILLTLRFLLLKLSLMVSESLWFGCFDDFWLFSALDQGDNLNSLNKTLKRINLFVAKNKWNAVKPL